MGANIGDIIHWNIRGIKDKHNVNYAKKVDIISQILYGPKIFQILNLQETHICSDINIPNAWLHYNSKYILVPSHASLNDRFGGIVVFLSKNFEILETHQIIPGRVLHIRAKNSLSSITLNIFSIYGKASGSLLEKQIIINSIINFIPNISLLEDFIFLGDFNFVSSYLDRNSHTLNHYDKICYDLWTKIELDINLVDCFRHLYKNRRLYSYSSSNNSKSRIDRIYIPITKIGEVLSIKFDNNEVSDHKIVRLIFKNTVVHGPGTYIFNNSLLNDNVFVNGIYEIFSDFNDSEGMYSDHRMRYDFLKMAIVEYAQSYSIGKAKLRKDQYKDACKNIEIIEALHKDDIDANISIELEQFKKKEIEYLNYKREGAMLRAKIPNFEENELQIAFVSRIEKLRGEENTISELIDRSGIARSGTEAVMEVVHSFYSELYQWEEEDIDMQNFFFRNINVRLSLSESVELGSPFDKESLFESLCDLPNNKSPGDDSLTKEFYVFFWNEIFPFYIKCMNEAKFHLELCESMKRGLITLVHKKNERNLLKNKRPISLINADLKVACRLLAKRLAKVIGKLISLNQTCIPGRQIFVNLHILQDLIDYINSKNQSAAVIFIDAEKAFDRMSHSFLFKTLRQFGCGESFINWIKTIYGHCTARVKVNGFTTSPINIKRGIRQGCPLSSLLYVLCAEVLSLEIKKNENIVGFKYTNKEFKNSCYADDLSVIVTKKYSIFALFETLENFGKATNAKTNIDKTEAIWLGNWKNNSDTPLNLKWTNSMVNNLGVWVGNDRKQLAGRSFSGIRDKIINKIKFWSGKGISLKGRVRVANTFIFPKLWYTCEIHNLPSDENLQIKRLISNFVWDNKFHERSLQGIEALYSLGGLQLINIDNRVKSLRIRWLSKLCKTDLASVEVFLANALISTNQSSMGISILKGFTAYYIKSIKNSFYKEACLAWSKVISSFSPTNLTSIKDIFIYENILLKDDDGRVYKPPCSRRNLGTLFPLYFRDLPFPILNRRPNDAQLIRSINQAFSRIQWNNTKDLFMLCSNGRQIDISKSTFKEVYWNISLQSVILVPWKTKWEVILNSDTINWDLVWKNVHDSMLNYHLQSTLWRMTNLGFISSNRLASIFGSQNSCRLCLNEEENVAHSFLFCPIANLVFDHFQDYLRQLVNSDLTLKEKAFGLLLPSFENVQKERLFNLILAHVKTVLFKRRAIIDNLNYSAKANIRIKEIKNNLVADLKSKYLIAKKTRTLAKFKDQFLHQGIIASIRNNLLIFVPFIN